ncbi:MAG TPA: hypothetical protein IAB44_05245 [Candidatus Limivivens intestinipullorum]|uniref:Uncharacterized protein n=1 Tax=Candidatus Limivivens intestinipullorum TaxID=2840858 RepID=A0A9D1ERH6_9FIRM|nr:hypothetical protein [Candidatus Limivivens intestinipullorum]
MNDIRRFVTYFLHFYYWAGYRSDLLNRNRENPFEIACGDEIFVLLSHVLTVCADLG